MTAQVIPINRGLSPTTQLLRAAGHGEITSFLERFATHLATRPASEATIYRYTLAATQLAAFLGDPDVAKITRRDVEKFIVARMETTAGSTVAGTFVALCQFFKFVKHDVEPDAFTPPTDGMTTPRFEERVIAVPDEKLLAAIIKSARDQRDHTGAKTFEGLRDEAILRMFVDTGARLSEITNMRLVDILDDRIFVTGKSKGRGPVTRPLKIGAGTRQALKAYLRVRRAHRDASDPHLWLSKKGVLTPGGVRQMVWRRSLTVAGPGGRIHPHQFRHAFAHGWQSTPGLHDGDLMEIMGWRTPTMLRRYGKSAAQERALNAHAGWLESRS